MPVLCFSPEDRAREMETRVVARIIDFVQGRDASTNSHLLPSALWEVSNLTRYLGRCSS
jgi:hypothetical protein